MTARFIIADVFDGLAMIEDGSVDLVVTSPPFLALRSYLPADHPDKGKEIGSESTPAEFIDTLLGVTQELRRVLAPHGSICVELGDTYAGSGGGGGDYLPGGWREGQQQFAGSEASMRESNAAHWRQKNQRRQPPNTAHRLHDDGSIKTDAATRASEQKNVEQVTPLPAGPGWPLAKSRTLIPHLYEIALAYGINPLTGQSSPAGQWRIRNVVTWARPNPPVGALGDKWRPATSDLIVACTSDKRYWDDLATRKPHKADPTSYTGNGYSKGFPEGIEGNEAMPGNTHGAPLLDYWVIPPGGYKGSHYAVFPEELVVPCVRAMCPERVCRTCGEPSRRIVGEPTYVDANGHDAEPGQWVSGFTEGIGAHANKDAPRLSRRDTDLGWSDCGHSDECQNPECDRGMVSVGFDGLNERYVECSVCKGDGRGFRPGLVLDPFAGSGTTLAVATGHGHDAIGIDLDERNAELARERIGPFFFEEVTA